jgi:hypothetical protein
MTPTTTIENKIEVIEYVVAGSPTLAFATGPNTG